jgi:hypothetical protein
MRGVHKRDLPEKTCAVCGRPFVWRKKWARDWEHVRYCSDACRHRRGRRTVPDPLAAAMVPPVRDFRR